MAMQTITAFILMKTTSKGLSDGQAFTVSDPSNSRNGDSVSLDVLQTNLRKITSSKVSLNSLDGVRIQYLFTSLMVM